ncbi:hypothetical protein [Niveibacterium sp. SC-1]|uniref:hypothetical protein n=1 Tax=Niveibacterium sp. SC-1 TaxID=3135646 RepID=UPI00311F7B05
MTVSIIGCMAEAEGNADCSQPDETGFTTLGIAARTGAAAGAYHRLLHRRTSIDSCARESMTSYRVVYKGEVLAGFTADAVRQSAAERLKATPAQIEILFSGSGAVLKKGLDAQAGERYIALLQRIGMLAHLEDESPLEPFDLPEPTPAPAPAPAPASAPTPNADFDAESTLVANPGMVTAFAFGGAAAADADNEFPVPNLRAISKVAPTIIVSRKAQDEVPKPSSAALRAAEPTLILRRDPPEQAAWSSTSPTVVVRRDTPPAEPPRPAAAVETPQIVRRDPLPAARPPVAEPTMIVRPGSGPQARVVCPQCGLEQVRRMFCERCGHDMSRPVGAAAEDIGPETVFVDPNRGAANDAPPPPALDASKPPRNAHWMIVVVAILVATAAAGWFFVLH